MIRYQSQRIGVLSLIFLALFPHSATSQYHYMRAHFIDVGQGNSTLLEFPCGAVLIDVGGQGPATTQRLVAFLNNFFTRRADLNRTIAALFITHTHIDHNRALHDIVDNFTVQRYIHNGVLSGSGRLPAQWILNNAGGHNIDVLSIEDGEILALPARTGLTNGTIDPISCSGIDPRIFALSGHIVENPGWPDEAWEDGNNQGVVIRVDFGAASFLFTGDLETDAIATLVDYYEGTQALDVDVYQVGHHGSHNGTSQASMRAMSPKVAVISMSDYTDHSDWTGWRYGHPRAPAVELLKAVTASRSRPKTVAVARGVRDFFETTIRQAIYATGWDGTVVVHARSDGRLVVKRER